MQIHSALAFGVSTSDILDLLSSNPLASRSLDLNNKLPLEIALEKKCDMTLISELLLLSLPFNKNGEINLDFPGGPKCWLHILTETNDEYLEAVNYILSEFLKAASDSTEAVDHIKSLAECRDAIGRKAIDIATPKCKRAIMSSMLFNARY